MCGGGGNAIRKLNDRGLDFHPLSNVVNEPLFQGIDPNLQGTQYEGGLHGGDIVPGSTLYKGLATRGLTEDVLPVAEMFGKAIAGGTLGSAAAGGAVDAPPTDLEAVGTSAPPAGYDPTLSGQSSATALQGNAGSQMPAAQPESPQALQDQGLQQTRPGVYEQKPTLSPEVLNSLGVQQTPTVNQPGQPTQTANGPQQQPQGTQPTGQPTSGQQPTPQQQPASSGNSTVDKILKAMKDNPVGTASVAALGANALSAKKQNGQAQQASQQQQQISAQAQQTANQLLQQYQSGTLSAAQQAQLDQLTQSTKNQLTQYFASIGQSDSTAARQAISQVDQQALGMKQQMLDNALTQGMNALGVASGPLQSVINYNTGQDQQLRNAFGNFATSVGTIFGRGSGTTQPQQAPGAPTQAQTQPTPQVQSSGSGAE